MKKIVPGLAAAIALCFLSACATAPQADGAKPVAAAEKLPAPTLPAMTSAGSLTLFQGGCFYMSSCDTSTITLRPDGAYTLKLRKGNAPDVTREGKLPASAFADAEAVLRENGFDAMPTRMEGSGITPWKPDVYPCMPHGPGWRLTRTTGDGQVQEVYWDLGCRSAAMDEFTAKVSAAMRTGEILR